MICTYLPYILVPMYRNKVGEYWYAMKIFASSDALSDINA